MCEYQLKRFEFDGGIRRSEEALARKLDGCQSGTVVYLREGDSGFEGALNELRERIAQRGRAGYAVDAERAEAAVSNMLWRADYGYPTAIGIKVEGRSGYLCGDIYKVVPHHEWRKDNYASRYTAKTRAGTPVVGGLRNVLKYTYRVNLDAILPDGGVVCETPEHMKEPAPALSDPLGCRASYDSGCEEGTSVGDMGGTVLVHASPDGVSLIHEESKTAWRAVSGAVVNSVRVDPRGPGVCIRPDGGRLAECDFVLGGEHKDWYDEYRLVASCDSVTNEGEAVKWIENACLRPELKRAARRAISWTYLEEFPRQFKQLMNATICHSAMVALLTGGLKVGVPVPGVRRILTAGGYEVPRGTGFGLTVGVGGLEVQSGRIGRREVKRGLAEVHRSASASSRARVVAEESAVVLERELKYITNNYRDCLQNNEQGEPDRRVASGEHVVLEGNPAVKGLLEAGIAVDSSGRVTSMTCAIDTRQSENALCAKLVRRSRTPLDWEQYPDCLPDVGLERMEVADNREA